VAFPGQAGSGGRLKREGAINKVAVKMAAISRRRLCQ